MFSQSEGREVARGYAGKSTPGRGNSSYILKLQKTASQAHADKPRNIHTRGHTNFTYWPGKYSDISPQAWSQIGATFTWTDRRIPQTLYSFSEDTYTPFSHCGEEVDTNTDALFWGQVL